MEESTENFEKEVSKFPENDFDNNSESKSSVKKLIISPHVDDEILACGGILDSDSFVYYCGIDESKVAPDPVHRIPMGAREAELKRVAEFLGYRYEINKNTKVNFYSESQHELKDKFERLINELRPEMIFIPIPSYNQDHKVIYDALQVALRPHDKNFFVKRVLLYEQPHSIMWEPNDYRPNYFVPIDIERKISAYKMQESQVRAFRSPELVKAIAKLRGGQAGCDYAEGFFIQRWVE